MDEERDSSIPLFTIPLFTGSLAGSNANIGVHSKDKPPQMNWQDYVRLAATIVLFFLPPTVFQLPFGAQEWILWNLQQ
jgi:hypothetical protein